MRKPLPCPSPGTLTMAQVSLWDNWKSDKRPKEILPGQDRITTYRYKLQLEVWTTPGSEMPGNFRALMSQKAWSGSSYMIPRDKFGKKIVEMADKQSIDPDYADELAGFCVRGEPTLRLGMITGHGAVVRMGGGFVPRNFFLLDFADGWPSYCHFFTNGESMSFNNWVRTDPNGKPFANPYVAWQCRLDFEGSFGMQGWDTRQEGEE